MTHEEAAKLIAGARALERKDTLADVRKEIEAERNEWFAMFMRNEITRKQRHEVADMHSRLIARLDALEKKAGGTT